MNSILAQIATNLEATAGASTTAYANKPGSWKRIANALEAITGSSASTNPTVFGRQKRSALALESISGTSGAEENVNEAGYLKRIAEAMEVETGATAGSYLSRILAASATYSGSVGVPGAPTITSADAANVAENATLSHTLTANEPVTWAIRTAAEDALSVDHDKFELSGSTLRWAANGTKDFEAPDDADANNTYVVVVRATDDDEGLTTDQTITITVTDQAEAVGTWSTAPMIGAVVEAASDNITLTEPAGVQAGDLMVAAISYRASMSFTLPTGWTIVATQQSADGNADTTAGGVASGLMAYIVRGGAAPDLTFTRTGGNVALGQIVAYRPSAGTPQYDTGSAATMPAPGGSPVVTATLTTAAANELLVAAACMGDNIAASAFDAATAPATASGATDTTTAPTVGTWIERADNLTATGADCALAVADAIKATADATGQLEYTTTNTTRRHVLIVGAFGIV